MLPSIRADQVFAKSCDHYVSRLSFHQGETFRLLWGIHDSDDPVDDLCYTD
ncbi:hypothetical protein nbrc107696_01410 [Gordonia spumicola]|uniref:Uncharacterized protein n=1 Tax=Gordonia spumicola TaxID=589161 RepID=A0A7I9V2R1_9ACTN|nr:hypothetical protein [Gordonia spumicola]GED99694.1 hypothetical protein nbrc107696_01410 [Gordonia spumicola]